MINKVEDHYWTWIRNDDVKHENPMGKYLFFSDDQNLLIEVAEQILTKYNLCSSKVSNQPNDKGNGFDYVLCVYDTSPRLKFDLANEYKDLKGIKYRYWKSDHDTRNGIYSEQYKNS